MSGYDPFNSAWGNMPPTSNDPASFGLNVPSSHVQPQSLQQHGAPAVAPSYPYPGLDQLAGASEAPQHAAAYPAMTPPSQVAPQFTGASSSTSHDRRRGHQQPAPQAAAISSQLDTPGSAQDYRHLAAAWNPAPTTDTSVNARHSSHSNTHGRQPGVNYNPPSPTQPSLGQQRRLSSSQHYDAPMPQAQARDGARLSVDASPVTQQRCIIPGCQYGAYYNVAEQEQMEYCGHGHEIQAIETKFAKPCTMCKGRPRRSGERVCGRVCRERERQAQPVQGQYYGIPVARREPRSKPR